MPSSTESLPRFRGIGLGVFLGLAGLFLSAAEVLRSAGNFLHEESPLASVLSGSFWPPTALTWDIAFFLTAQFSLHLAFGIGCWVLSLLSGYAWPNAKVSRWKWMLLWYFFSAFWILMANATWYPLSLLGEQYAGTAKSSLLGISTWSMVSAAFAGALIALFISVLRRSLGHCKRNDSYRRLTTLAVAIIGVAAGAAIINARDIDGSGSTEKPHVILLGIDSLRLDLTSVSGTETLTPNLARFLAESTVFPDTITPLARTYPAWVSLLTGRHPHSTGAVVNLLPRTSVDITDSLPDMLGREGYHTVYAMDEVRFSNIDDSYGFDQVITPSIGAADFLLAMLNDAPLSNLLVNTVIGKWLFPFTHANRAAAKTYDPDVFVKRLKDEVSFERPTFLALHLTLAHWPYRWQSAPAELGATPTNTAFYKAAVRRVDRQFEDVVRYLKKAGALQNAIVVVFSDHGEALGAPGDAPYSSDESDQEGIPPPSGHGTSVLSPHQYQTLLAWRTFGTTPLGSLVPGRANVPASLEDITPTLADTMHLRSRHPFDGLSLRDVLLRKGDASPSLANRIRFTETEFNPRGFGPGEIPTPAQVREAVSRYALDSKTGRLHLRPEAVDNLLLKNRQYAAIYGQQLLAALPADAESFRYVLVNHRAAKLPARTVQPKDMASDAELLALWQALRARYKELAGEADS